MFVLMLRVCSEFQELDASVNPVRGVPEHKRVIWNVWRNKVLVAVNPRLRSEAKREISF